MHTYVEKIAKATSLVIEAASSNVPIEQAVAQEIYQNIQAGKQCATQQVADPQKQQSFVVLFDQAGEAVQKADLVALDKAVAKLVGLTQQHYQETGGVGMAQPPQPQGGGMFSGVKRAAIALVGIGGLAGVAAWLTNRKREKLALATNPMNDEDFEEDEMFDPDDLEDLEEGEEGEWDEDADADSTEDADDDREDSEE